MFRKFVQYSSLTPRRQFPSSGLCPILGSPVSTVQDKPHPCLQRMIPCLQRIIPCLLAFARVVQYLDKNKSRKCDISLSVTIYVSHKSSYSERLYACGIWAYRIYSLTERQSLLSTAISSAKIPWRLGSATSLEEEGVLQSEPPHHPPPIFLPVDSSWSPWSRIFELLGISQNSPTILPLLHDENGTLLLVCAVQGRSLQLA